MKNAFFSLVILASSPALASDLDQERVEAIQSHYGDFFEKIRGVNMTAISRCDSTTGFEIKDFRAEDTEACLVLGIAGGENMAAADKLFGPSFRLNGIWVTFVSRSPSQPEPSVSVRN